MFEGRRCSVGCPQPIGITGEGRQRWLGTANATTPLAPRRLFAWFMSSIRDQSVVESLDSYCMVTGQSLEQIHAKATAPIAHRLSHCSNAVPLQSSRHAKASTSISNSVGRILQTLQDFHQRSPALFLRSRRFQKNR